MIKIGTSGWAYKHWGGCFYPENLKKGRLLPYYTKTFDSVEVNNTFYNLPNKAIIRNWREITPSNFLFAIKANRYITHMKNLLNPQEPVNNLIEHIQELKEKLGPILFQLPPHWKINSKRLENFLKVLPNGYKFTFEFRNKSWYQKKVYNLLEKEGHAFCVHDHRDAPSPTKITSDFVYIRFHGPDGFYRSKYKTSTLNKWSRRIKDWDATDLDVYAYFNNDAHAYAIENAKALKTLLD